MDTISCCGQGSLFQCQGNVANDGSILEWGLSDDDLTLWDALLVSRHWWQLLHCSVDWTSMLGIEWIKWWNSQMLRAHGQWSSGCLVQVEDASAHAVRKTATLRGPYHHSSPTWYIPSLQKFPWLSAKVWGKPQNVAVRCRGHDNRILWAKFYQQKLLPKSGGTIPPKSKYL